MGHWAVSLKANRSTSVLPNFYQIRLTVWFCNLYSPGLSPYLESKSAPKFKHPGMCTDLMDRSLYCAQRTMCHARSGRQWITARKNWQQLQEIYVRWAPFQIPLARRPLRTAPQPIEAASIVIVCNNTSHPKEYTESKTGVVSRALESSNTDVYS